MKHLHNWGHEQAVQKQGSRLSKEGQGRPIREGEAREALARYFLSAPPPFRQSPAQAAVYRKALRQLLRIETAAVLHSAGLSRPLCRGDLPGMLEAVTQAAGRLRDNETAALVCRVTGDPDSCLLCAFEPRLVQMAAVGLLRAACASNPDTPVEATIVCRPHMVVFSVTGQRPARERAALAVARETARLHQGSVAVCGGTTAFSLRTSLPARGGVLAPTTVSELLQQPLSSVQVGFYAML